MGEVGGRLRTWKMVRQEFAHQFGRLYWAQGLSSLPGKPKPEMVESRGGEGDAADGVIVGINDVVCAIGGQYEVSRRPRSQSGHYECSHECGKEPMRTPARVRTA